MTKVKADKPIQLTENTVVALKWLQANNNGTDGYTGAQIAEATGLNSKGIFGTMGALVKKGLVDKGEIEVPAVEYDKNTGAKKDVMKKYKTYFLTDAGVAFEA